jgi:hypothetical protein
VSASSNNSNLIFSTEVLDILAASHKQNSAFCRKQAGLSSANEQAGQRSGWQNFILAMIGG